MNSNSRIISTDEDPRLRIESSGIINLRGVSTKLNKYIVFTMQMYKKLILNFLTKLHSSSGINLKIFLSRKKCVFLEQKGTSRKKLMMLPSASPDLISVENLWAVNLEEIYVGGR